MAKMVHRIIEPATFSNAKQTLRTITTIVFWLRHYSNLYSLYNDKDDKIKMDLWQAKADEFIKQNIVIIDEQNNIINQ